jgi:hypothetical protein
MSVALLAIHILIDQNVQLILILVIGSAIGITMLANFLGLSDELPEAFRIPKPIFRGIISPILIVSVGIMSFEVMSIEQDMRTEGVHGILSPRVLGLNARPARLFDLEEKQEPSEAKLLGGNGDMYLLCGPCKETTHFVPVGFSGVMDIDKARCQSP